MKDGKRKSTPLVMPSERPAFSPEGIDLTLIRWMLSLTPTERLLAAQNFTDSAMRLRDSRVKTTDATGRRRKR